MKHTAKAPKGTKSWDRIRFYSYHNDMRPITWPPLGPYWCSGSGDDYLVIVAYVPHGTQDKQIKALWPEARDIDRMQEDVTLDWYDRFPKPDWWIE